MLKLAISNIAWGEDKDIECYELMRKHGYKGLEIAPTRVFPDSPYDNNSNAKIWSERLKIDYGLEIPSMQSIWFGRKERIFASKEERYILTDYTRKAIEFAEAIGCMNLVLGCPQNRYLIDGVDESLALGFFKELGDYAVEHGTVIGLEANPIIYNTNYINDTASALKLIDQVSSEGFKLNLDIGAIIYNNENIYDFADKVNMINHVHISEPWLKPIEQRTIFFEVKEVLELGNYDRYISIEMGKIEDISLLEEKMIYVKEIFCGL